MYAKPAFGQQLRWPLYAYCTETSQYKHIVYKYRIYSMIHNKLHYVYYPQMTTQSHNDLHTSRGRYMDITNTITHTTSYTHVTHNSTYIIRTLQAYNSVGDAMQLITTQEQSFAYTLRTNTTYTHNNSHYVHNHEMITSHAQATCITYIFGTNVAYTLCQRCCMHNT